MSKKYPDEPRELLLRVQPDPHRDKTIKSLVTLTGWPAQVVEEIEAVEKRPMAQIVRDLVIEGIRARSVNLENSAGGRESTGPI